MTENWLETLHEVLDHVEYGIVILDDGLKTRFLNRSFRHMWALPDFSPVENHPFESLMQLGRDSVHEDILQEEVQDYVSDRIARVANGHDGPKLIRLIDGRIIKYECITLPTGGRMLSYTDQTELVKSAEKLELVVNIDPLTQIHNRRYLYTCGQNEVARARRYRRPISLIVLDIDHFKQVNETHGHAAGDTILCLVARCCRDLTRATDLVGRLGGAEFGLVLPETSISAAITVADKLRKEIAEAVSHIGTLELHVTASVGVACLTEADTNFEDVLRCAGNSLDIAKQSGRDRVVAETR